MLTILTSAIGSTKVHLSSNCLTSEIICCFSSISAKFKNAQSCAGIQQNVYLFTINMIHVCKYVSCEKFEVRTWIKILSVRFFIYEIRNG